MATKKNGRISVSTLEKYIKESCPSTKPVTEEICGMEVTIKPCLSLFDMLTFVDGVVKSCFNEDGTVYLPEIRDFAIRCAILQIYANFSLPSNIERRYEMVCHCGEIIESILKTVNRHQYEEIINCIIEKTDYMSQVSMSANTAKVNELLGAIENLGEHFSKVFSGIEGEDISRLVNAITDGKFDESKLIDFYQSQSTKEKESE